MGRKELPLRKASQEEEIDRLLEEEFLCSPSFAADYGRLCGLKSDEFNVRSCVAQPSLGGQGFGDLLVEGRCNKIDVVLLIENKITAGPAIRQAQRYRAFADHLMEAEDGLVVLTVLNAPSGYHGERDQYDAFVTLEDVRALIRSDSPSREAFRRSIISRALNKKQAGGVNIADPRMHELKMGILAWMTKNASEFSIPELRAEYYDGDSWLNPISHPDFPSSVWFRYRKWTSAKANEGRIDLIFSPVSEDDEKKIRAHLLPEMALATFSKGKGILVSLPVPMMNQDTGFVEQTCSDAVTQMRRLLSWYQALKK
ncbi:MAG: hypothetical protein R3D60_00590 [Paracoccaceae bacterium]